MSDPLRVLMVEDSTSDAELILRELRRAGFTVAAERVETAEAMGAALAGEPFDLVLSDYQLPSFGAPDALNVLKASGQDLPFIVVSGAIGESTAVALMKAGAHDYVMKDSLARLGPAIERELREAGVRLAGRRAAEALRASEESLRRLTDATYEGIAFHDKGILIRANRQFFDCFGYQPEELLGRDIHALLIDAESLPEVRAAVASCRRESYQCVGVRKDGSRFPLEIQGREAEIDGRAVRVAAIRDISERKRAEAARVRLLEDLRAVNEMAIELGGLRDAAGVHAVIARKLLDLTSGALVAVLSYRPEEGSLAVEAVATAVEREDLRAMVAAALGRELEGLFVRVPATALEHMLGIGIRRHDSLYELSFGAIPAEIAAGVDRELDVAGWHAMSLLEGGRLLGSCVIALPRGCPVPSEEVQAVLGRVCSVAVSRERAERARRESEARFSTVFASSPVSIAITRLADGALVDVNPAWSRVTGVAREEALGRSAVALGLWRDRERRAGLIEAVRAGASVPAFEMVIQRPDGEEASLLMSAEPIDLAGERCMVTSAVDISDRKEAEQALRESERAHRELVENLNDAVFTLNVAGRVTYISPVIEGMLGLAPAELLGLHYRELVHPDEEAALVRAFRDVYEGVGEPIEVRFRAADGRYRWLRCSSRALLQDGLSEGLTGVLTDVTARHEAEAAYRALQDELRQAQKMEAIGQLAGGVAHDFNNILCVIEGHCDRLLRSLREDDPLWRSVRQIQASGERAAGLTRQLLAFSRKQALRPEVLELDAAVRDLEPMLGRLIGEDVELVARFAPDAGRVKADRGQLEQVVVNLAVNARDAMPRGGRLAITTSSCELSESQAATLGLPAGRYTCLTVADTGSGIDEAIRERVFEPFFTTKSHGTGLGLSTVYGIVTQSGGFVRLDSEVGRGSTFTIYLPVTDEAVAQRPAREAGERRPGAGELILVVEDEEAMLDVVRDILADLGYRTAGAVNAGEALLAVENGGLRPDLLLTDVVMPGMNGPLLAERLRKRLPELKVLLMSGYTDAGVFERAGLGPDTPLLRKPFKSEQLAREIRSLLTPSPARA